MTPDQLQVLRRSDPALAARVASEHWTRGHASGTISALVATQAVTRAGPEIGRSHPNR